MATIATAEYREKPVEEEEQAQNNDNDVSISKKKKEESGNRQKNESALVESEGDIFKQYRLSPKSQKNVKMPKKMKS